MVLALPTPALEARRAAGVVPSWIAYAVSALVGCVTALLIFPGPVLLGTAEYWNFPQGVVGSSWGDMAAALSGYDSFVQEPWQWPLFHVTRLGGAGGVDVIYTDSTPLLSLMGRVLFQLTGHIVPLYGAWAGACLVGMALASTLLARALGAHSVLSDGAAAVIGVSMPPLLARWGHLSLMGQWLIPLALAAYVLLRRRDPAPGVQIWAVSTALSVLALLIHPYLFLMVTGIMAAVPLQAAVSRRMRPATAASVLAGTAGVVAVTMGVMGHFSQEGIAPSGGFGSFSTNVASAFVPQMSGILPLGTPGIMQGTFGQFEGFAYLGLGMLLLLWVSRRTLITRAGLARHKFLLVFIVGCTALAVSNEVYLAQFHLVSIPLPDAALRLAGVVRASGRFIWVPVYLTAGLAVAAAARHPQAGIVLLAAALLQWMDVRPWRGLIRESVAHSAPAALDTEAWVTAIQGVDRVIVDPPWLCTPEKVEYLWVFRASVQIQLLVSRVGRSTNTAYTARGRADCWIPPLGTRDLQVQMHVPPVQPMASEHCEASPDITACSLTISHTLLRRLTRADTSLGW